MSSELENVGAAMEVQECAVPRLQLPRIEIGPTSLTVATMQSALEFTESILKDHGNHFFCFCEASLLSTLILDSEFASELRGADAVFPDGVALLTLARLQGRVLPERVTGPNFLLAACAYGVTRGWRHFFYGGGPGVAEALADRLRQNYPGVIIAGTFAPSFRPLTESEESATKQMIESARPDILWVCLGSPKQEYWCARHVGRLDVPLMLPVGAAFDFHSGNRPWAPAWIRKIGMEWAFRSITGGKRTLLRNLRCVSIVGAYLAKAALDYQFGKAGLSTRRVAIFLCTTASVLVAYGLLTGTKLSSHLPNVLLLALLASVCLLLGRMVVRELRETGPILLAGLRRPTHSLLKALTYPFWDAVGLAGALAIAMRVFEPASIRFWHSWFVDLPIWVTPTLCLLAVSRTYLTVWTRARILDVLMLLFTLQAGLLLSLGIALLIDPSSVNQWLIRALVLAALGHGAMILSRVFYRCVEAIIPPLMSTRGLRASVNRVVLYGGGGRCQLFLKELRLGGSAVLNSRAIIGLIDDEPALHFKWVCGRMVLGAGRDLAQLIPYHRITGIIITTALRPESLTAARELAFRHGISLNEWRFVTRDLLQKRNDLRHAVSAV